MPTKETYKTDGTFVPAVGGEQFIYTMPDQAELDAEPATEYQAYLVEKGVNYVVVQNPLTMQEIRDRLDIQPIKYFPPAGGSYFYTDGHTEPPNLRDLIMARVTQGWTITPLLEALLGNDIIDARFLPD